MPRAKYIGYLILITIVLGIPLTYFFGDIVTKYMEDRGYLVPWEDAYFAYLTQDSLDCIECHGKAKEVEAMEIETAWGKQKWGGYKIKSTYITPHTEIKKLSFMSIVYAAQFEGQGNHPVGIPYSLEDEYHYPPKCSEIQLPFGYIECESCHNVTPHGSVKCEDNKSSKLCLGCHNK